MFALTSPTSSFKSLGSDFSRCFVREYVHFGILYTLNSTASGVDLFYHGMVNS